MIVISNAVDVEYIIIFEEQKKRFEAGSGQWKIGLRSLPLYIGL